MRKNIIISILLLSAVVFAANSEVIKYTNNWGKHPMFNVAYNSDAGIEVVFSIHEMVVEEMAIDGIQMKSYSVPGIFLNNDEGAPNLGGTGRYIAIPQGATARATIVDARTEVYRNVEVAPAPNIPLDNDDSPLRYVKNASIYEKNEYYPDSPVKLSERLQMRGVDCVVLGITPFQYNPVTKELIVYKDIRVRVDFIGGNRHFGDDALRNIYWEPILQGNLLNYSSLPQVDFFAPERILSRDGYEYIIIVPDDPSFIAWGDTIKRWRNLQGISTNVYTTTQVGGNTTTAIETFLNNAYNTWNPRPVGFLLLSDVNPSGDVYGIPSPIHASYCVSDLIYADVNSDNMPDMFHGRITAQNESQLNIMVNKFLKYERTPPTDPTFSDQPMVCAAWQTERWFQLCGEVVRGFMDTIHGLNKNPTRLYAIYSGTPTAGGAWSTATNTATVVQYFFDRGWIPSTTQPNGSAYWSNGNSTLITQAINNGAFLLQHRDHGAVTGWGEPAYSNSDINNLTNDEFIFVNSHNCLTGQYDYSSECFTEKFHRHNISGVPKGALGLNAASEVSYSFVNDCYCWGMYDCMWQHFMPDYPAEDVTPTSLLYPAAAMNYGKIFLYGSSWPYNTSNKLVTYHLFHHHGDVFNPLYSEVPQNLTVVHMPTVMAGVSSFTVTANDSAIVALTVNGEIIGAAMATGNPQSITIAPQIPGTNVIITVTKQNYYRYQATVPVVSSSYPYIIAATTTVNDSGANGQINPGERIDYGTWAKNIGIGTAQGIYGKLSTSDSYVTIQTDSTWFGTIPADDSVYSNPVYRFRAARNTPNNHLVNFTFTFKDNYDSTFLSYKSVRVYAPIISYQSVAVMGGNNNGIFNRGETVDIVVTLKNEGGADAENVTANLLVNNPDITLLDGQGSFGTIAPSNSANNSTDPFTVCADTLILPGTMVQFRVAINHSFYTDTFQFSLPVEIYLANFDDNNGDYIPAPATGGWEWGAPTSGPNSAHSTPNVWATVLGGNYANSANWTLTTPEFTATGDTPQLSFWHWYSFEGTTTLYDGGNVKISTDYGETWTVVTPVSGYTGTAASTNVGVGGQPIFGGSNQNWTEVTFNLPLNAGQRFLLRWHFGSDGSANSYAGWYIDDITGIGFAQMPPSNNDVGVKSIISPTNHHFVNTVMTPSVWVKNFGLLTQTNFPVSCSIVGPGNILRYNDTQNIASLASGDSMLVSFTPWTPTIIETCNVTIQTSLTGDEYSGNDVKTRITNVTNLLDITIGTGTSSSSLYPMYGYDSYSVTEAIYLQSEIGYYGYLNNIAYYKNSGTAITPIENVKIYMKHTTETSLATGAYDTTGYTCVFSGTFPNDATSGWMSIELDDPFLYNNSDNLDMIIIKGPPNIASGYPSWRYTSTSPNYQNRYGYSNTTWPTSLTRTTSRPNIRFTLSPSSPPSTDVGVHAILYPQARHFVNTQMTPLTRIKNYGTLAQTNFPVVCSIFGAGNALRYSDEQTVTSLNSGDTVQVSFTSFTPAIIETCLVEIRTNLVNDSNPINDQKTQITFVTNSAQIIIGTGTSGSSLYCMYGSYNYSASEAIYLQPEIGLYGYITNLAYYKTSGTATTQFDDVKIYMKLTTASTIATGAFDTIGYTRVYSGAFPINAVGWMDITLNTPYLYNNEDNLQILILKGPPQISSGYPSWQYTTQSPNYRNRYGYNASNWPTSLTQTYYRPNIRFYLTPTAPGIEQKPLEFPLITTLNAIKPNPVTNGQARISFSLAQPSRAALKIYDASGRIIKTLLDNQLEQGVYNFTWNGKDENNRAVAEGIYFYTLETSKQKFTKKMIFTR
jgi:hypothetical protein